MLAPGSLAEVRPRRARAEKKTNRRKRLTQASNAQDKSRLEAKLHKLGLVSPGQTLLKA